MLNQLIVEKAGAETCQQFKPRPLKPNCERKYKEPPECVITLGDQGCGKKARYYLSPEKMLNIVQTELVILYCTEKRLVQRTGF